MKLVKVTETKTQKPVANQANRRYTSPVIKN